MRVKTRTDMIDFTRAFDSAWERMVVILFRPFDLGKWFVIGFSAFLAGLLQGGNGFNGSGSFNNLSNFNKSGASHAAPSFNLHQFNSGFSHVVAGLQLGIIVAICSVIFFFIMAIVLLFYWLGARGQFLFLDNIVRNRGNIGWPWQHYSQQGNSLFGIYILFMVASFVIFLPLIIVAVVISLPLLQQQRWPAGGEIGVFVLLGLLYFVLMIVFGFVIFIFREFGVPLMFRNGLLARPAFLEVLNLVKLHPGSVAIFVLLRIALALAIVVISIITCCCCVGVIPYLGTVAILPALIYVRCFTLDCLAQFGPQYDVWTVDVPAAGSSPAPLSPPPPLG